MKVTDCNIPGFVDLQVNGYLGHNFSSATLTKENCVMAFRGLLASGTAVFLPTIVTSPLEVYERNLPLIAAVAALPEFKGHIPGLHIEGPFISGKPGAFGAHELQFIQKPDVALLQKMQQWSQSSIRLLTLAPEVDGAEALTHAAVGMGIAVSVGHSLATDADLDRIVKAGATAFTHVGNGLPNMIHRHFNPIWPVLACDGLTGMFIADGHHLPASMLQSMIRAKGVERSVIVSDASSLAGLPPGHYHDFGEEVVLEENGHLHIPAKQCLAGSSFVMLQCMNHLATLGFLEPDDMLNLGFYNPLKLIGVAPETVPAGQRTVCFDGAAFSLR